MDLPVEPTHELDRTRAPGSPRRGRAIRRKPPFPETRHSPRPGGYTARVSYEVLARKWRPQTFDDVVGQAHVTTPLRNAIRMDRMPHAVLFTGPRGCGKTSSARILAQWASTQ